MKNILVPIETHSAIESVLKTALLLGRRFESYIEGMPLAPDLPDLAAFDPPVGWMMRDQLMLEELAEGAQLRFEGFMTMHAAPANFEGSDHLSYGMAGDRFFGDSEVARFARVFDVTVLGRPGSARGDPRMATAEALLFESGRPVLLAPPEPPETLGETIIVAWNRSMKSARTAAFAMPLLLHARRSSF